MNRWTLSLKSVSTFWRTQLTVAAGLSVAAIVLVGSLIVGDSVKHSLRVTALQRIGKSHYAILGGERFFTQSLADRLTAQLSAPGAPVVLLQGSASHPENECRANRVQIVGVDARFWNLAPEFTQALDANAAYVNEGLARQLNLADGDTIVLRINKPSALPKDAMLSSEEDLSVAMRLRINKTLTNAQFSRFSLRAEQAAPYSVFVPIDALQSKIELGPRANLILLGEHGENPLHPEFVQKALDSSWTLEDAQLSIVDAEATSQWELRSERVFLAPLVADAALGASPEATPLLTYFVNKIQAGERATPYSMVTAVPPQAFPDHALTENAILINAWLAEDLEVAKGDAIVLRYFVMGPMRRLVEEERSFVVAGVLPFEGLANDRTLMPDLPGISDSENCREWEPGFPIDLGQIRDKDETYWDEHAGTPKAFISLASGQAMWRNRYGDHTAVRYNKELITRDALTTALQSRMAPTSLGIQVAPIRAGALKAGAEGMDFASLFVSFSFFLVIAALLLAAMLFAFNLDQRRSEAGLLLTTGFTRNAIRGIYLREGLFLAAIAGLVGVALGTAYTRALLYHLQTTWREAIGGAELLYHAEPKSLLIGGLSGLLVGAVTILLVLRKQFQCSPTELLRDGIALDGLHVAPKRRFNALVVPAIVLVAALISGVQAASAPVSEQGPRFFGSGMMLLISLVSFCHVGMLHLARRASTRQLTHTTLMLRGMARRSRRSLATLALLAAGAFMVIAVSAHRQDARLDAAQPHSGTGGFAYVADFSSPLLRDLNSPEGQAFYGIDTPTGAAAPYTQIRVGEGDEASCLNLNRPQHPRLWGVDPARLQGRFTFLGIAGNIARQYPAEVNTPWSLLDIDLGPGRVPAIGDNNSIMWSLGKKLGDTIDAVDERGKPYELVLVGGLKNSIFQGGLLISEAQFLKLYPSASGYQMVLVDAPGVTPDAFEGDLNRAFRDHGIELHRASDRLNAFNALQNTYLAIFQSLGALGLLLGSIGLGIVVLRNVLERRQELAMLRAVGHSRSALRRLIFGEHALLLATGLLAGVLAAALALLPTLRTDAAALPLGSLALTLFAVLLNGLAWTALATHLALRGDILPTLRND